MKNERIECSFQDASTRAKKKGGIFWGRDVFEPYEYQWDDDRQSYVNQHGKPFEFNGHEFDMVWVYEPPEKSAFQEWEKAQNDDLPHEAFRQSRKEGWNACLEAVLKMVRHDDNFIADYDIETLREP